MIAPDTTTLLAEVRALLQSARAAAARQVNSLVVLTNFEIGRRIVLHEQGGEERAEYGRGVLQALSVHLTEEFGRGFSVENLRLFRQFFMKYQARIPMDQPGLMPDPNSQTPSGISSIPDSVEVDDGRGVRFPLSWSHYVFLLGVDDSDERSFYEVEAARNGWSLRELRRQFDSSLYERLALSRDKDGVRALAVDGQLVTKPADLLKEPYVLEFLGLDERPR